MGRERLCYTISQDHRQNVVPFACPLHYEASVVDALDASAERVVLRQRWIPEAGSACRRPDPEEDEIVQQALKRLSPKEAYDRVFRMRRAFQCSLSHQLLPKTEWTKTNDDYPYLSPIIREITAEQTEREDLESMIINKRKATPKGSSPNIESKH